MTTNLLGLAHWTALLAPALYSGLTLHCSLLTTSPTYPLLHPSNALPDPLLARQWLQIYQAAPAWVRPLIAAGTISHLVLAYHSPHAQQRALYLLAAVAVVAIMPITFFYFEPGINGACKWKVSRVLKEAGEEEKEVDQLLPPGRGVWRPSWKRQSATARSRAWAERTELKDLVVYWGWVNHGRWVLTLFAAALSGYGTFVMGEGR